MISLVYSTDDPFRLHGIRHFWETEGLPEPSGDARVCIAYGDVESKAEYTLRVLENPIQEDVCGWLSYGGERAPLFETPSEVGGEPLAAFESGETYPCVAEREKEIVVGFDAFHEAGRILAGHLEGRYPPEAAEIPALDIYMDLVLDCLGRMCKKAGVPLARKDRWPNGAPYAVCLTHDVDEIRKTYQHVSGPLKSLVRGKPGEALSKVRNSVSDLFHGRDPYWTFEELINVEDGLGVKSSLYFLEEKGRFTFRDLKSFFLTARRYEFKEPRVAAMIRRLDAGGWDVGLHGSYYSYDKPDMLKAEKAKLEAVVGHPVTGIRQHHLNFKFPDTWRAQEAAGFRYDCTLGYKDKPGFRWATCRPFTPFDPHTKTPINITAIPTIIMDTPLIYQKTDPQETINRIHDKVKKHGGQLTILWHHTVYNEKEFPGRGMHYKSVIDKATECGAWLISGDTSSSMVYQASKVISSLGKR